MSESKKYVIARNSEEGQEFLYFKMIDNKPCNFRWVSKPSEAFYFESMKELNCFKKQRKVRIPEWLKSEEGF